MDHQASIELSDLFSALYTSLPTFVGGQESCNRFFLGGNILASCLFSPVLLSPSQIRWERLFLAYRPVTHNAQVLPRQNRGRSKVGWTPISILLPFYGRQHYSMEQASETAEGTYYAGLAN